MFILMRMPVLVCNFIMSKALHYVRLSFSVCSIVTVGLNY